MKDAARRLLNYARLYPFNLAIYCLIFGIGILVRLLVLQVYGSIQWDEAAHSVGGIFISRLLGGSQDALVFGSRYIASYPATLSGVWFYPLTYGFLSIPGFLVFGFTAQAARITSVVFSVLLIHASILVSKEVSQDHKVALVTAFLVATSSILVVVGSGAMLDVPQTALTMYTILFWIRAMNKRDDKAYLKVGILGGLTGLMKPTGIFILLFVVFFQIVTSLISREKSALSKGFLKGMISGFLVFSVWWGSALLAYYVVGGQVGRNAVEGVGYWFNFFGVFGNYVPPWYSPQWSTYGGWTYYANSLTAIMGVLPFLFSFIGVFSRIKELRRTDYAMILFALGTYAIQSFASNKNPRYIITCLPILYIYSSVGLVSTCSNMVKLLPRPKRAVVIQRLAATFLIVIFLAEAVMPLQSAINANYLPGMGFGTNLPIEESVRIIKNDGGDGIIVPDSEDNYLNVFTLTFYVAPIDNEGKLGCFAPPSKAEDILSSQTGNMEIRYVIAHDPYSNVSKFIQSNPCYFELIGKAENSYGTFLIYKITRHVTP
jgi:hypothetical protein